MSIFEWQNEYCVDNGLIDEQHKRLLEITETLFNSVIQQDDDRILTTCFNDLLSYTKKHFKEEEAYFKERGANGLSEHHLEHQKLAAELIDVWDKENLGFHPESGRILLSWVEDRLIPHMMIDDQETYSG